MDDEYDFRKSNIAAVGTVAADEGEEGEMSEGASNKKDVRERSACKARANMQHEDTAPASVGAHV